MSHCLSVPETAPFSAVSPVAAMSRWKEAVAEAWQKAKTAAAYMFDNRYVYFERWRCVGAASIRPLFAARAWSCC